MCVYFIRCWKSMQVRLVLKRNFVLSPTEGEGDILFFGADPVGVSVTVGVSVGISATLSCLHDIS